MGVDKEIGGGSDKTGYTVAIGKRVSESYLRLYDKKKEQESKGETIASEHWVRCELETHKRRANALFQELVCQVVAGTGPAFFAQYLNGLIQFREPGEDTNKSRWEVSSWWADFIGTIEKVRVTLPKPKQTIQKVMTWFEDNIAPMAAVIAS